MKRTGLVTSTGIGKTNRLFQQPQGTHSGLDDVCR
jgi:hypothetical protein